jgi:hypothetical protein
LCTVFCSVNAWPPAALLADAAAGGELQVHEGGGEDWRRLSVTWPDQVISFRRLGPSDPDFAGQVEAVTGFILAQGREEGAGLTPRQSAALIRARGARHILGVAVTPEPGPAATDRIEGLLRALARAAGGLILRDGRLLDPELRVFLDAEGGEDADAALLVLPSAAARKTRSVEALSAAGVPVPDLPTIEADEEARLRPAEEAAARAQALLAVAVRGAGVVDPEAARALLQERGLWEAATPSEQAFLEEEEPDETIRVRLGVRREALWALLWALGHVRDLGPPTEPCELERCVQVVRRVPAEAFVEEAKLRPLDEVLDQADLAYRAHGAAAQALLADQNPPGGLRIGVVRERHTAFFWLLGYMGLGWDAVAAS